MSEHVITLASELPSQNRRPAFGTFRILDPKPNSEAHRHDFLLADYSGSYPARMQFDAPGANGIQEYVAYYVTGYMDTDGTRHWFQVTRLARLRDEIPDISLIPAMRCAEQVRPLLPLFTELVAEIEAPELSDFIDSIFADPKIFIPYFNLPASVDTHHPGAGGNGAHCIEVGSLVRMIARALGWDRYTTDLGICGALTHDMGKVAFFDHKFHIRAVGHELRGLEVLAPYLSVLDQRNHDAAEFMRYLLTFDPSTQPPQSPVAAAIRYADALSAISDASRRAFARAPDWKRYAALDNSGRPRAFLRCVSNKKKSEG